MAYKRKRNGTTTRRKKRSHRRPVGRIRAYRRRSLASKIKSSKPWRAAYADAIYTTGGRRRGNFIMRNSQFPAMARAQVNYKDYFTVSDGGTLHTFGYYVLNINNPRDVVNTTSGAIGQETNIGSACDGMVELSRNYGAVRPYRTHVSLEVLGSTGRTTVDQGDLAGAWFWCCFYVYDIKETDFSSYLPYTYEMARSNPRTYKLRRFRCDGSTKLDLWWDESVMRRHNRDQNYTNIQSNNPEITRVAMIFGTLDTAADFSMQCMLNMKMYLQLGSPSTRFTHGLTGTGQDPEASILTNNPS